MFENYTGKAARVLKQAEKASRELGQNYTGTEHILLAMLREKDCAAAQLLIERKVEEEKVLELIRDLAAMEKHPFLGDSSLWRIVDALSAAGHLRLTDGKGHVIEQLRREVEELAACRIERTDPSCRTR